MDNKEILMTANKAVTKGDNEGFLAFCTEDTNWEFVGDITLKGNASVRKWMAENYIEPPQFDVTNLIAEKDFVTAIGKITIANEEGKTVQYEYCDVWRFRNGKMAGLRAFVIESKKSGINH